MEVNLLPALSEGYKEEFSKSPDQIGASAIGFGLRKNVIEKRLGLTLEDSMKMLAGKLTHRSFQKQAVMELMTKEINKQLGYTEINVNGQRFIQLEDNTYLPFMVEKEKYRLIEVIPGKFLRMHSDIYSTLYTIEIKTTSMPLKMWAEEIAAYQVNQLNTYLGFNRHEFGFLLRCDLKFYLSASTRWEYIWNNYFRLYPLDFNRELFNYTLNRVKEFFKYMDDEEDVANISCPEFIFECSDECREHCPNPIDKVKVDNVEECSHCKGIIEPGTTALIRDDLIYHYTKDKTHRFNDCVKACKDAWGGR
jgi:hypothetical protein